MGIYDVAKVGGDYITSNRQCPQQKDIKSRNEIMKQIMWLLLTCGFVSAGVLSISGQTWTQTGSPSQIWSLATSSADGSKLFAAGSGIYASSDSGITWGLTTAPSNVGGWHSIASSADGAKLVAVANGPIYTSVDSGASWVSNNAPSENWSSVASSSDGKNIVAVATYNGTGLNSPPGEICTSTNFGATWIVQTNAPVNNWLSVVSSTDGSKLTAVNFVGLYTSTNSGITWTQVGKPAVITWNSSTPSQILASSGDGARLVLGFTSINGLNRNLSPIYISTNGGLTWSQTSAPSNNWTSFGSSVDGSRLIASAGGFNRNGTPIYGPILTSTNFGSTWVTNDINALNWAAVATSADGSKLIAVPGQYSSGPVYTSYSTPNPLINASPTNKVLVLSWTIPATNFVLQQSSDLSVWSDITELPNLNLMTLKNEVVVSPSNTNSFYRLKTP